MTPTPRLLTLLVCALTISACRTAGTPEPTAPTASSTAATATATATADVASMRQVAVAGCVEGLRSPNVARYAARAEESGSSPELAKAEAEYAMGKLQPVFEDACRCVLADLLSGQALAMKKEDFAASMTQRAADCLPGMIEAIDSRLDKADVEAFRARLRAGLEAQSPTQPEKQP